MLYLSYRGLCFGWGWNCYLLLEGFEDAPEGYSFRCNCFFEGLTRITSISPDFFHKSFHKFAQAARKQKSENQIIYICDFRRYEKSAFSNILL